MEKYGAEYDSFGPTAEQLETIEKIAKEKHKAVDKPETFEEALELISKLEQEN